MPSGEKIVARLDGAWGHGEEGGEKSVLLALRSAGVRAFKFRVDLRLWPGHPCWREIVLPASATFANLHDAIQSALLWWDYHLYRFELRARGEDVEIMDEREIAELEEEWGASGPRPQRVDSARLLLSDVFPRMRKARYFYDYGDGWEHDVRLLEVIDSYDGELPACVAGAGDAPPEDVGGVGGFEHFLHAIGDPAHSEYDDLAGWGWSQFYEPFDLTSVNRRMRAWKTGELVRAWDERHGY